MAAAETLPSTGVQLGPQVFLLALGASIIFRTLLPMLRRRLLRGTLARATALTPALMQDILLPPWWHDLLTFIFDACIAVTGVLAVATTHQWETLVRQRVQTSALEFVSDPSKAFATVPPEWRLQFRRAGVLTAAPTGQLPQTADYLDSLLFIAADGFTGPVRSKVEITYSYDQMADVTGVLGVDMDTKVTLPSQSGMSYSIPMPLEFGSYSREVTASKDSVWAKIDGAESMLPLRYLGRDSVLSNVPGGRTYYRDRYRVEAPVKGAATTVVLHSSMLVPWNEPLCWAATAPTAHLVVTCVCPQRTDVPRLLSFSLKRPRGGGIEQQWERVSGRGVREYTWSSPGWRAPGEGFAIIWPGSAK
jgi:hypothetical protein